MLDARGAFVCDKGADMTRLDARSAFRWSIPERFNIGSDAVDRHGDAIALIELDPSGNKREYSFRDVSRSANRLANVLLAHGLTRGDRVAILLPQRYETAVAHVAAYKAGLVAVPLFTLFGEDALEYRIANSAARALVTDCAGYAKLAAIRERLPELKHVYLIDGDAPGAHDFHALL